MASHSKLPHLARRLGLSALPAVWWSLGKERNVHSFEDEASHWKKIADQTKHLVISWAAEPFFCSITSSFFKSNWDQIKKTSKIKPSCSWSSLPTGSIKFNFDGSFLGNAGLAGTGGGFCGSEEGSECKKMEGTTLFTASLEGMKSVKSDEGEMLTMPFLDVCKQVLPVIDKFGAALVLVKSDVGGNISRLEANYSSNTSEFSHLYSMVRAEIQAKTAKASSSCTNGLLWLTRAMDFLVQLFRNLLEHPDWTMSEVCNDSYSRTLKKWHGWLASSGFSFAMKLAPDRKKFMEVIGPSDDVNADMEKFCATFSPLLEENHKFLASVGLDDLKAS